MRIASAYRLLLPFLLLMPAVVVAQKKPSGIVIPVDDVKPATTPYNQFDSKKIIEQSAAKTVLVSSDPAQQLVPSIDNSFIGAIHSAYAQHHNLVLSPDDIWIQIALGVSIHINQNWDALNAKVVTSPKREMLFVRLDSLADMQTPDWQQLIDTFAVLAKHKVQPEFYRTMLPEFSTSTPETRSVLNAILLSSVKESLEMRAASGCGIPNIILTGTKADWEKLLVHVGELEQYDLKFWTDELKPILQEFVNAFDKKIDRSFWQRIYKYREGYMVMEMNGWASKLFPYFAEAGWIDDPARVAAYVAENPWAEDAEGYSETVYYPNPYLKGDDYLLHAIDLRNLPTSVCTVPFTYSNLNSNNLADHEQLLFLHAGFSGIVQQGKTLAISCNPSWYVVRQNDYLENEDWASSGGSISDLSAGLWIEKLVDGQDVNAIYHPEKNKTPEAGLAELREEIRKHIKKTNPNEDLTGMKMHFIVSHFGNVINVVFNRHEGVSTWAKTEIDLKLKKLNYTFRPTYVPLSALDRELHLDDLPTAVRPQTIPANSIVTLTF